jgi:hypothetical protein
LLKEIRSSQRWNHVLDNNSNQLLGSSFGLIILNCRGGQAIPSLLNPIYLRLQLGWGPDAQQQRGVAKSFSYVRRCSGAECYYAAFGHYAFVPPARTEAARHRPSYGVQAANFHYHDFV